MGDLTKWVRKPIYPVRMEVPPAVRIETGDLLYYVDDYSVSPASHLVYVPTNRNVFGGSIITSLHDVKRDFAMRFAGVALSSLHPKPNRWFIQVATAGVFRFKCFGRPPRKGENIGAVKSLTHMRIRDQAIEVAEDLESSIGICDRGELFDSLSATVEIVTA